MFAGAQSFSFGQELETWNVARDKTDIRDMFTSLRPPGWYTNGLT